MEYFGCIFLIRESNNLDNSRRNTLLFSYFGVFITEIASFRTLVVGLIPHIFAFHVTLGDVSFGVFDWL